MSLCLSVRETPAVSQQSGNATRNRLDGLVVSGGIVFTDLSVGNPWGDPFQMRRESRICQICPGRSAIESWSQSNPTPRSGIKVSANNNPISGVSDLMLKGIVLPTKVLDGLFWCEVAREEGETPNLHSKETVTQDCYQDNYLYEVMNPDYPSTRSIRELLRRAAVLILLTELLPDIARCRSLIQRKIGTADRLLFYSFFTKQNVSPLSSLSQLPNIGRKIQRRCMYWPCAPAIGHLEALSVSRTRHLVQPISMCPSANSFAAYLAPRIRIFIFFHDNWPSIRRSLPRWLYPGSSLLATTLARGRGVSRKQPRQIEDRTRSRRPSPLILPLLPFIYLRLTRTLSWALICGRQRTLQQLRRSLRRSGLPQGLLRFNKLEESQPSSLIFPDICGDLPPPPPYPEHCQPARALIFDAHSLGSAFSYRLCGHLEGRCIAKIRRPVLFSKGFNSAFPTLFGGSPTPNLNVKVRTVSPRCNLICTELPQKYRAKMSKTTPKYLHRQG
ncbi:hypothetical protein J6590_080806 [Homalodisca vitripennis]|nr:hypothetical protein J6590_080806 [Homalodisca vitripennis]